MEQINKLEFIKDIVLKEFDFLTIEYNYGMSYDIEHGGIFIEVLKVSYLSEKRKRSININYHEGKVDGEFVYTLALSIIREPYEKVEDYFSFDIYLHSIGENEKLFSFKEFDHAVITKSVKELSNLLQRHASEIVQGEKWLSNYYPRRD